jgi:hypothetical protein
MMRLVRSSSIGSGVDLPRFIRHHEQLGAESAERLPLVKNIFAAFLADWDRLKLGDTFASPEDFFAQCLAREAGLKTMGINAIRSNPRMVGCGMPGCNDPLEFGEGLFTAFRELKHGVVDAVFDAFYPVRWCTFAEPVSVYRGAKVRLEAILSNEDAAPPGQVPARLRIVGQDTPQEAVAGSFRTSHPTAYWCDTMLSVHELGVGRFVLNAFRIREELGRDPTAERMLRNMLRHAARDSGKPVAPLPDGFPGLLQAVGYE